VQILGDEVQELEDALFQLLMQRDIETAVGVQLNGLGDTVGESRMGKGDDAYRFAIKVRIAKNNMSGTPEQMISFLKLLTGGTLIDYAEIYPAKVSFFVSDGEDVPGLQDLMQSAAPAGVKVFVDTVGLEVFRVGFNRMSDRF
jgi:hypothetical protein